MHFKIYEEPHEKRIRIGAELVALRTQEKELEGASGDVVREMLASTKTQIEQLEAQLASLPATLDQMSDSERADLDTRTGPEYQDQGR